MTSLGAPLLCHWPGGTAVEETRVIPVHDSKQLTPQTQRLTGPLLRP